MVVVALAQHGLPPQPKVKMARNYWDELSRGRERRMHGQTLKRIDAELHIERRIENTVWELLSLAANLMLGLAINRRYA